MCFWRGKKKRISDVLELLEREIVETEFRLRHSQERLRAMKIKTVVVGITAVLFSALWLLTHLQAERLHHHVLPLALSFILFVFPLPFLLFLLLALSFPFLSTKHRSLVCYGLVLVLFETGVRRDERRLREHRAAVKQRVREYKSTTDFDRARTIIARYEQEAALPYDELRQRRQKAVKERQQRAAAAQARRSSSSSGAGTMRRSLWDSVVCAVLGDDEEDGPECALVCRTCAMHNGFVGASRYPGYRLFPRVSSLVSGCV